MTDLRYKGRNRVDMLKGSIRLLEKHMFPTTPSSMYVFTRKDEVGVVQKELKDLLKRPLLNGTVHVVPFDPSGWQVPAVARDEKYWHGRWNLGYRLMGDWRLEFMPHFAKSLGHRYVLQFDDDSYLTSPVGRNLVTAMREGEHQLAAYRLFSDQPLVVWGLAELTKYFLITYQYKPTKLFEHCDPPGLEGLYSSEPKELENDDYDLDSAGLKVPKKGGWDRQVVNGNCVIIDLNFWYQPLVQRYIQLCRASAGSFMYRWNEQSVLGMINHLFVRKDGLLDLTTLMHYTHRGEVKEVLKAGGIKRR